MPASWDVDGALSDVVDAINEGAHPMSLSPRDAETVKEGYREGFEAQRARDIEWREFRSRILSLANKIGRRSAMLTVCQWLTNGGSMADAPKSLDLEAVRQAGYWISTRDCPDPRSESILGVRGGFCPDDSALFQLGDEQREFLKNILTQ